ncbi:hypothetical protein [Streptomyces sp. DvalAA-19]|uniref:hypothetical protein n=1 Tax=Streptomyces sp. DvalAA-19 TaxID=1839761 RepID=UPI00114CF697|nr:hypothetical protein [Streptomyces sp. DvalAA-19]
MQPEVPEKSQGTLTAHGRSFGSVQAEGEGAGQKSRVLKDALGVVLGEIEVRALEDAQRRKSEQGAMAEPEVRWRAFMEDARKRAVRDHLAEVLHEEIGR